MKTDPEKAVDDQIFVTSKQKQLCRTNQKQTGYATSQSELEAERGKTCRSLSHDCFWFAEGFHMTSLQTVSQKNGTAACWNPRPILWEFNSILTKTLSFVPLNLHRCWERE